MAWVKWDDKPLYASDYFDKMFDYAVELIKQGNAYVCDLSSDEVKNQRGTLTKPGIESPFRDRSVSENLDLFQNESWEFQDGKKLCVRK